MVEDAEDFEIQSNSKHKKPNNIDVLVDELLVEILCRLPSHKAVVICKFVCKHWAALVSQPFFICRYVSFRVGQNHASYAITNGFSEYDEFKMKNMSDRTFGIVVRTMYGNHRQGRVNKNTWKGLIIRFNDPIYNPKNVSVTSLPRLSNRLSHKLTVVGACNDLLLYEWHADYFSDDKLELYISNVQTGQWLELPSLYPENSFEYIGLICDPYYSTHAANVTLNDASRACIFVIPWARNASKFPAHLFSSQAGGMWRNVVLSLPFTCQMLIFSNHFWIGRNYYFHCWDCVIGFDPFVIDNDVINCHSLHLPHGLNCPIAIFGVFHERVYTCDSRYGTGQCRVWVLEDYEAGRWSLQHNIMRQDWIRRDLSLKRDSSCFGKPISFHPANPDVVYMLFDRWIVLCKLSTREMEIASTLPEFYEEFFDGCSFQITLPAWPSPLPFLAT